MAFSSKMSSQQDISISSTQEIPPYSQEFSPSLFQESFSSLLQESCPSLTLEEFFQRLKSTFQEDFSSLWIQGEVSSFVTHDSGHRYFSLKEGQYLLDSVCWKSVSLESIPKTGETVACYGSVVPYGPRSKYQFVVQKIRPLGQGSLLAEIQRRREKLAKEGLFLQQHKKPLPSFPDHVGILTAQGGAVIHDILVQWKDRFPSQLTLYPIYVQGPQCVPSIIKVLDFLKTLDKKDPRRPDVLLLARGGGSMEDLLPFQEEVLVRAIFSCPLPLISALGHEKDVSLVDEVADFSAPTPTAGIASLLPLLKDCFQRLDHQEKSLQVLFHRDIIFQENLLQGYKEKLLQRQEEYLCSKEQHVDDLAQQLLRVFGQWFFALERRFLLLERSFDEKCQQNPLKLHEEKIKHYSQSLIFLLGKKLDNYEALLHHQGHLLYLLSHQSTLDRGFFLVSQGGVFKKNLEDITSEPFLLHGSSGSLEVHL